MSLINLTYLTRETRSDNGKNFKKFIGQNLD